MKSKWLGCLAFVALGLSAPAAAKGEKPLFASDDQIHISIQAPLSSLIRNRESNSTIAGTIVDPNGQSLPITLALRGITRRASDVCDFPPLRVEFPVPPPATSMFAGQKKLKLVTHCKNSPNFQQYVLLEYSAYRLLNLLSQKSFRVRLASIDYKDADGRPIISRVGYFLEPLSDLAHRNGMNPTHAGERIPASMLNPIDAGRYALFQHMIGNHDWSMRAGPVGSECCHNAELIGPPGAGQVSPVPYDFDFSGYVDPPYATPPAELDISDVRQRLYRGYCFHNDGTIAAARQMRAARPQMMAVLSSIPGMEAKTQARAAAYLNSFFADIASDAAVTSNVLKRCVG